MSKEKKKSRLQIAKENAEVAIEKTNETIDELGRYTGTLYNELTDIQSVFDVIRNVPNDQKLKYEELKKVRLNWKQQAQKIEDDYKKAEAKNLGAGAAGIGAGVAVAALGPTAAMGVATTFGVASTGTAISSLSGAAATHAALAWLGGGTLAAGGSGMAGGSAFLALAGPVGWAIAGVALLGSGVMFFKAKSDQKKLEDIFTLISERDTKNYDLAVVELNERIHRIIDETQKLHNATAKIKTFGVDYNQMTEPQQYELGSYVNLMLASTQLLVNPIWGLKPKYYQSDFDLYIKNRVSNDESSKLIERQKLIISLCNLLYRIDLDDDDKKLFTKSLKKNKEFLSSVDTSKRELEDRILDTVIDALEYRYSLFYKLPNSFNNNKADYKTNVSVGVILNDVPSDYDVYINNTKVDNDNGNYSLTVGRLTSTVDIPIYVKYHSEVVSSNILRVEVKDDILSRLISLVKNFLLNHFNWKYESLSFE